MGKNNVLLRQLNDLRAAKEGRLPREADMGIVMKHMANAMEEMKAPPFDTTQIMDAIGDIGDRISFLKLPDSKQEIVELRNQLGQTGEATQEVLNILAMLAKSLQDTREDVELIKQRTKKPKKFDFRVERDDEDRISKIVAVEK